MLLFFDTETTGKYDFKAAYNAEHQPRIIQLAAMLTDTDGRLKCEMNVLIKPDGWFIPADAQEVHGISTKDCDQYGVNIETALQMFDALNRQATRLIGHNVAFDIGMLRREINLLSMLDFTILSEHYCTKEHSTNVCKLPLTEAQVAARKKYPNWSPPGGWDDYKAPTLQEAYKFFYGSEFEEAHDAMADVKACRDVYIKLKRGSESAAIQA